VRAEGAAGGAAEARGATGAGDGVAAAAPIPPGLSGWSPCRLTGPGRGVVKKYAMADEPTLPPRPTGRPRLTTGTPEDFARRAEERAKRMAVIRRDCENEVWAEQVAVSTAAGKSVAETAKQMRLPERRVAGMRSDPAVQERIADLRQYLRDKTLQRAARLHDKLYDGVEAAIEEGEGKQVDAWTRAAASMERVRQSASGEQMPPPSVQVVNQNVAVSGGSGADLAALLEELGIGRRVVSDGPAQ